MTQNQSTRGGGKRGFAGIASQGITRSGESNDFCFHRRFHSAGAGVRKSVKKGQEDKGGGKDKRLRHGGRILAQLISRPNSLQGREKTNWSGG